MIENIDRRSVCGHLKATLSGVINDDVLQKVVGTMVNMDPNRFEQIAKELAIVFTEAFLGNFSVPPEKIPHIGISLNKDTFIDRHGLVVNGNHYKEEWLNICLHLPGTSTRTLKIWAGLTNLKSACVINKLSRSEKDAQYDAFVHTTIIDPELVTEWTRFVDEFTPYLLEGLELQSDREYDPLWSAPLSSSKHSVTLNSTGKLKSCMRGDAEYCDPRWQLKHPAINRLARLYPHEFAEAAFLGYTENRAFEWKVPDPYQGKTIPIGKCSIVPKRAQKPRTVWIPLAIADSLSRPAFHKLEEIERRWNLQGVMSHDDSRAYVQEKLVYNAKLQRPKTYCSYDQSSFTDNFSYDIIQRPILQALVRANVLLPYDLDVIDTINHGLWDLKDLGRKYELRSFGTGTGMGTPPSFALASVANGYLLAFSFWKVYKTFPRPRSYNVPGLIVGDDCIIFDATVGDQYEDLCSMIGLKINQSKSFRSDNTAEFCGKIITPEGIWDKHKLIDFTSLDGITDLVKYYKESSDLYFSEFADVLGFRILDTVQRLQEIPEPYGAKSFKYHDKDLSELNDVELVSTISQEYSQMTRVDDDKSSSNPPNKAVRRDFREIARRQSLLPEFHFLSDEQFEFSNRREELPALDPYRAGLVHNAILEYNQAIGTSWELLYQKAQIINDIYNALISSDDDFFNKYASSRSAVLPSRHSGESDSLTKRLMNLNVLTSEICDKGGDECEI